MKRIRRIFRVPKLGGKLWPQVWKLGSPIVSQCPKVFFQSKNTLEAIVILFILVLQEQAKLMFKYYFFNKKPNDTTKGFSSGFRI